MGFKTTKNIIGRSKLGAIRLMTSALIQNKVGVQDFFFFKKPFSTDNLMIHKL